MCYSKKIQALNCEVPLDWLVVVHILVFQQKRMLESAEKLIDLDFIFGSETFLPEYRIFPEVFVAQEKNFNLHHLGCCETFINKMMQSLIHRSLSSKQKISNYSPQSSQINSSISKLFLRASIKFSLPNAISFPFMLIFRTERELSSKLINSS